MKILGSVFASFILIFFVGFWQPVFAQSASLTATVRVNPLKVEVSAPSNVTVGDWFEIKADISNLGLQPVTKISAVVNTPSELKVKGSRKRVGDLAGGQATTVIWQARVIQAGINLVVQVEVEGDLDGEKISASDSTIISATGSLGFFIRRLIFGV